MITEDDLKNYYSTQKYFEIRQQEIELLKLQTGSISIDGMPKGKGYKENYRLEELLDKEQQLISKNIDLINKRIEIWKILDQVSASNRLFLEKRFICGMKPKEIVNELWIKENKEISENRVNHIIGYGLQEFRKILNNGENNTK